MRRQARALVTVFAALLSSTIVSNAGARPPRKPRSLWSDPARAVQLFEDAVRADPLDADAAVNLAQAYARVGRRRKAEDELRRAMTLPATGAIAWASLADLLADDPGRFARADELLTLFRQGLERFATDPTGHTNLSLAVTNFERSIGRTQAARARLAALDVARLSPEQRKRVLDLDEAIRTEERARALEDQPPPVIASEQAKALADAEAKLDNGDATTALSEATRLASGRRTWIAPRWLAARADEALGRFDDAERELTVLLQLAPSHAEAWRRLGRILVEHGGALEADRAGEALRQALVLEPRWWDLWLLRAEAALRGGHPDEATRALERYLREAPDRAGAPEVKRLVEAARIEQRERAPQSAAAHRADPPSPRAMALYHDARDAVALEDPDREARDLVDAALKDSPGYVDAAALRYALAFQVPPETERALWGDGDALVELSRKIRAIGRDALARAAVRPWLDRAVELGTPEALLERALVEQEVGDRAAAESDLVSYLGSAPEPPSLDEARMLLASMRPGLEDAGATLARVRLLSDRPDEAIELLGGKCDGNTPPQRLVPIGTALEWSGPGESTARAIACYREALRRTPGSTVALTRIAGIGARAPLALVDTLAAELQKAAAAHIAPAEWALARLALEKHDTSRALQHAERFLAAAAPDDPDRANAQAARDQIVEERSVARRRARLRVGLAIGAGASILALLLFALLRPATLARAITLRPSVFPEVSRAINELRHDVLKHRTSVLALLSAGAAKREEVARVLLEPQPASQLLAERYERLRAAAAVRGVPLRPLALEPVLGPLLRDLRRAEALVTAAEPDLRKLDVVDSRLRRVHSERMGALLKLGPRTRVDAPLIAGWIREAEAQIEAHDLRWTPPVLRLGGLALDFPVERDALATIFANLLRNAQAAVAGTNEPFVQVSIDEERDATGRRTLLLLVGDSSPRELTLAEIEARPGDRGLGIVRDRVREWRGQLILRTEATPPFKSIGASFPVHA